MSPPILKQPWKKPAKKPDAAPVAKEGALTASCGAKKVFARKAKMKTARSPCKTDTFRNDSAYTPTNTPPNIPISRGGIRCHATER